MASPRRIAILLVLAAAVAVVLALRSGPSSIPDAGTEPLARSHTGGTGPGLPRLVDLGADACAPCIAMAPILVSLRVEYAGQFDVVFIDVWKNPGAGLPYAIRGIPTQIFFDESGLELFRHAGFFSREDILATWSRLGYTMTPGEHTGG